MSSVCSPSSVSSVSSIHSQSSCTIQTDTLVLAHVLFRHGARNIVAPYPTDPYRDEVHWPEGFGQLTPAGIRQCHRLGEYFRRRYGLLLDELYSYKEIYVQSTDFDRTIMSAQAVLAGIYPPTDVEKFDDSINWQPIPVHTIPTHMDHVLATGKKCPRFQLAHVKYLQNTPSIRNIFSEFQSELQHWSEQSGINIQSLDVVNLLHNTLCVEQEQNKPLPAWAQSALGPDSPMPFIANMHFQSYASTPELARLRPGYLIKEILDRFEEKIESTLLPDRKLWLYSAHDLTIINVLNSLGLFKFHFPPYTASLHFELYRSNDDDYYLQIFYRTAEEEYPLPMIIPDCGIKCTLKQFRDLYHEIIPEDFEEECQYRV